MSRRSEIGRRPVRVARARLGQPQGWGLPVEAQRCLFRRERVGHDACGCPAPRTRCYATAAARAHEMDANRAGVCDMGVQARGLLPARAGRRGSRGGLRAAKRRPRGERKPDRRFRGGKQRFLSTSARDASAAAKKQPGTASRPPLPTPRNTQAPAPAPQHHRASTRGQPIYKPR